MGRNNQRLKPLATRHYYLFNTKESSTYYRSYTVKCYGKFQTRELGEFELQRTYLFLSLVSAV